MTDADTPKPGFDRRRHDRRSSQRAGKYDRRRNLCDGCMLYKPQSPEAGLCMKHQKLVKRTDFACIQFVPQTPDESEPE